MPTIPATEVTGARLQQLPEVMSVRPRFAEAWGAMGSALADAGEAAGSVGMAVARAKRKAAEEEKQAALTKYTSELAGLWGGKVDEATGAETPGLWHLDPSDTDGAAKKLAEWQRGWRDSKDGDYAKLTPLARSLFDREAQAVYARFGTLAVDKDFDSRQTMKARSLEAFIASQTQMAGQFAFDNVKFGDAEYAASHAIAKAKVGPGLLNPEETAPAKLRFASEVFRKQYEAEKLAASEAMRFERAKTLLAAARPMESDEMAAERIGLAREIAKGLEPKLALAVGDLAAQSEGYRASVRKAGAAEEERARKEHAELLDVSAKDVKYRYFRGEIDARAAIDAADRIFSAGLDGGKATELRQFIEETAAKRAAVPEADRSLFAKSGTGDTSAYLALQAEVMAGAEPWATDERIEAAVRSGALEEGQYKTLSEMNRKGMDERTGKAVRAALSAAADLDPELVGVALDKDTAAGAKARGKLMSALGYEFDRPWRVDVGRAKLTADEFDGLVENTRAFIQANPDKDPYRDFIRPLIEPKVAAARALELAKRLSADSLAGSARQAIEREAGFARAVGGMADKPLRERLAVARPMLSNDGAGKERAKRVGAMVSEYRNNRGNEK